MIHKEYMANYEKENLRQIRLKINRKTEPELLEWMEQQENIQGYIKDLIQKDMEEKKKDLAARIRIENRMLMQLDPIQLRFSIEKFRDKNINDRGYQKELINTFIKAVYVFDDRLKIVVNRGSGDDIEIPFEEIAASEGEESTASCVRTNANKPYQTVPVRTPPIMILPYGIVIVVSY